MHSSNSCYATRTVGRTSTPGAGARELAVAIVLDQDLRTTEIHHQVDHRWL